MSPGRALPRASAVQARLLAQPLSTYQKLHSWVKVRNSPALISHDYADHKQQLCTHNSCGRRRLPPGTSCTTTRRGQARTSLTRARTGRTSGVPPRALAVNKTSSVLEGRAGCWGVKNTQAQLLVAAPCHMPRW